MGIFYAISWIFEGIELLFSGLAAIEPIDINIIDADDQKSIAAFVFSYGTVCGIIYSCMCYILPKRCKVIACITCIGWQIVGWKGQTSFPSVLTSNVLFSKVCIFIHTLRTGAYFSLQHHLKHESLTYSPYSVSQKHFL